MKIRSIVLSVVLLFGGASAAHADVDAKIIGGERVDSAPWAVQLFWDNHFGCSASLIAPHWVLTARHCVGETPTHVFIGDVRLGQGTKVDVTDRHIAPGNRDIALLRLADDVDTTYVELATEDPPEGATNHIYGWGTYEVGEGKPVSPYLKRAAVTITEPTTDAYGGPAVGSRWATGTAGYGDSGGPQLHDGVQVGVCSTGDYEYTQYASVAASRPWISEVAGV